MERENTLKELLNTPINTLRIPTNTINTLMENGYYWVGDIVTKSRKTIKSTPHLGVCGFRSLDEFITENKLYYDMSVSPEIYSDVQQEDNPVGTIILLEVADSDSSNAKNGCNVHQNYIESNGEFHNEPNTFGWRPIAFFTLQDITNFDRFICKVIGVNYDSKDVTSYGYDVCLIINENNIKPECVRHYAQAYFFARQDVKHLKQLFNMNKILWKKYPEREWGK